MAKTIISERWELVPLEQKKLLRSFGWSVLALVALFVADYLKTGALDAQVGDFAVFLPFLINALNKFAGQHTYKE